MGLLLPPPSDDERGPGAGRSSGAPRSGSTPPFREDELLGITIPDDLSELDDEVRCYRRELRRQQRRARLFRLLGINRLKRMGLTTPAVAAILLTVGLFAAVVSLLPARAVRPVRPVVPPLAAPAVAPGSPGGLVPDVTLRSDVGTVSARTLRPAVLILIPAGCNCAQQVHEILGQVDERPGVPAYLIGNGASDEASRLALDRQGGDGRAQPLQDMSAVLPTTYGASTRSPTLLFVTADGRTSGQPLVFTTGQRIESRLAPIQG